MDNVVPLRRPKRRRCRCDFCGELYLPERGIRGLCNTCWPAFIEVGQCPSMGLLGDWEAYKHVIAPLARGFADLVLCDAVSTRFHAGWRLLNEQQRAIAGAEISRLAVESRRRSLRII
jgi:hypothetical protein